MVSPFAIVVFLAVGFAATWIVSVWLMEKVSRRLRLRRRRIQLEKELAIEEARQAALPKLDTRYLIRMPDWAVMRFYGAIDNRPRKAFGTRYCHLIVFDEVGDVWLGMFMPATLRSLRDSEYARGDYWVWLRGGGEAYSGTSLVLDGVEIWAYPVWLEPFDAHVDDRPELCSKEWKFWAELEKEFEDAFKGIGPYKAFEQMWSADPKIHEGRHRLFQLQMELKQLGR